MAKRPRVLCVDDQAPNLKVRTLLLEQFGCDTITAEDHRSALHAISGGDIDVAVLDYHLADGENGEDLARDIRVMQPKLPLIMLTGDSSVPASAREAVNAVLVKGTSNPTALLDLIQQFAPDSQLLPHRPMLISEPHKEKDETERKRA